MRIIGLVLAALALAGASAAYAAPPTHEWNTINETFVWDDCGFTVEESVVGSLHSISWFNESGARTRQLVLAPDFHVTWRNAETGESVSSASPYVVHKQDNPDGSATITFTGLVSAITGGGPAYVTSGRRVIRFSASGIEEISSVGPTSDLCEALTATIG
jgi:hypothetical protein